MLVEDPVFSGDIQECSNREVQKHPVSLGTAKHCVDGRNQTSASSVESYPESANTGNGFLCNDLDRIHNFMQL